MRFKLTIVATFFLSFVLMLQIFHLNKWRNSNEKSIAKQQPVTIAAKENIPKNNIDLKKINDILKNHKSLLKKSTTPPNIKPKEGRKIKV